MIQKISIIGLILVSTIAYSQKKITGIIKDSLSKEVLSFASVQFQLSKDGKYTDENGYFELSTSNSNDTLIVNFLSYKEKKIPIKLLNYEKSNVIQLVNTSIELPIFVIKRKINNSKKTMLGHFDFPTKFNWGTGTGLVFMNYYFNKFQNLKLISKL